MVNETWRNRINWTDCINDRAIATSITVNKQRVLLMSVYFPHSVCADHHVKRACRSSEKITKSTKKRIQIVGGETSTLNWGPGLVSNVSVLDRNKLARSVTELTQACDGRLARLSSYIHHTDEFRQCCHVGNTAQHCRLGLVQDSDFAGDLEDSKSTSGRGRREGGECLVYFSEVEHCSRQLDVQKAQFSLAQFYSLDAGLRMDGLLVLDLWDILIEILRSTNNPVQPNHNGIKGTCARPNSKTKTQLTKEDKKLINCLMWNTYQLTHILLKVSLSCTFWKTMKLPST